MKIRWFLLVVILVIIALAVALFMKYRGRPSLPPITSDYNLTVMGDSLAEGLGASTPDNTFANQLYLHIKASRPKTTFNNLGKSSAQIDQVLSDQLPQVPSSTPQLVVVVVGTNDLIQQSLLDDYQSSLDKLLTNLKKDGRTILLFNIPQFSLTPSVPTNLKPLTDIRTKQFNLVIEEVINKHSDVKLFDFYSLSGDYLKSNSNLLSDDKFHPNDTGYKKIAEEVYKSL